jgi:hypothetical protein
MVINFCHSYPLVKNSFLLLEFSLFAIRVAIFNPVFLLGLRKNNLVESNCQPPSSGSIPSLVIECKAAWEDGSFDKTLLAEASFDFRSGQHLCRVSTQSKERTNKITLLACLANSNVCSDRLSATFYSPVEISAKELTLKEQAGEVVLRGPNQVLAKIKVGNL